MGATNKFIVSTSNRDGGGGKGKFRQRYALVQKSFSFMTLIRFTLHTELTNFSS